MDDKKTHLTIKLGKRELVALAALALVAFYPGALSTEQITMTTYYPSPYGVYDQMRSQNNTFLSYASGAVGIGTITPAANTKLNVAGNTDRSQFDGQIAVGGVFQEPANSGAAVSVRRNGLLGRGNVLVEGAENNQYLRVGDAWGLNGIYSESGDLVVGSFTGSVRIGPDDSQYIGNSCRFVQYTFGNTQYCPNLGRGWSALGYSSVNGQITGGAIPISGYMYCCKMQQY